MEIEKYLTKYMNPVQEEIGRRFRSAVIVCPGGGYTSWAEREAEQVALRYQAYGLQAFVLRYPLKQLFPQAMYVLAEAVSYIRSRAEEWDIDKDSIFGCGFSAGGHLVASLGCYGNKALHEELSLQESCVLNGMILGYPVITGAEWGHKESIENLCKGNVDLQEKISLEKQVSSNVPPIFMWHCFDDTEVDVENTFAFARALKRRDIPCECHIFQEGGHGISLCDESTAEIRGQILPDVQKWFEMSVSFIERNRKKHPITYLFSEQKIEYCVEAIHKSEHIDDEIIGYLTSSHKKYIYGNGLQVAECLRIFREMGVALEGIVLPSGAQKCELSGYWGELMCRTRAYTLEQIGADKESVDILLAIDRSGYDSAKEILDALGFTNVYTCCWERNLYMKQICYHVNNKLRGFYKGKERCHDAV